MTLMEPTLAVILLIVYGLLIFVFTRKDSYFIWPAIIVILLLLTLWEFTDWAARKLRKK